jgi:hypothetical protein
MTIAWVDTVDGDLKSIDGCYNFVFSFASFKVRVSWKLIST